MSHKRWMITLIFILIISLGLFIADRGSDFGLLKGHSIVISPDEFTPNLSAKNYLISGDQSHTYKAELTPADFKVLGDEDYRIILYRLADNAHEIYFNGTLIGAAGNQETLNSNLWNGLFDYAISKDLVKVRNELTIVTRSSYRSGLSAGPIYIVGNNLASEIVSKLSLYGDRLIIFSIGFIMFSTILSLLSYSREKKDGIVHLYIAIATILTGIYFIDYVAFEDTLVPYLIYKKITMGGLFFAVGFYSYAISEYFDSFIAKYAGHCLNAGTAIILLISTNMIMFKHIYTYWYYVAILCLFIWIGLSIINVKKDNSAYIFLMSFSVIAVYASIAATMDLMHSYFRINSPVMYIIVAAMIPVLLVYEDFNEQDRLLVVEKGLRQREFFKSITDELTGVWNQRYLAMLLNEDLRHYTMAIMDIDNFKEINDTYGHAAGDEVLKAVASLVTKTIRKSDKVCRYGGDEFVIILDHCPLAEAYDLMESLRTSINEMAIEVDGVRIDCTVSIGMDFDEGTKALDDMFKEVDSKLYAAKKLGKNRIAYRENIDN